MYIIAGLGNPGREYEKTRHNAGFEVINRLAERLQVLSWEKKHKALAGKAVYAGEKLLLLKPQTYMNLSGESLLSAASFYRVTPDHILVISDDIDLAEGRLRIRKSGSAGGHNGLKSIISNLGSADFVRIRVGVGSKPAGWDLADYVLGRAKGEDAEKMEEAYADAVEAVLTVLESGVDKAMNEVNRKEKKG